MFPVSSEFLAALRSPHTVAIRVDAYRGNVKLGVPDGLRPEWVDDGLPVEAGSVSVDLASAVRRQLSITMADPALNPKDASSPLAPYGTELFVQRGITFPNGQTEYCPVGRFRIDDEEHETTGTAQITAPDRARAVAEARFIEPRQSLNGSSIVDEIRLLIGEVLSTVTVADLTGSTAITPRSVWEEDRWSAISELAEAIGAEVAFSPLGDAVIRPVPTVDNPPVWTINAGATGVLIADVRRMSREGVYNGVMARSARSDDSPPTWALVTDDNPSSPTWWDGPFGHVPYLYESPLLTSEEQAREAATAILAQRRAVTRQCTLAIVPNPALEVGDVVDIAFSDNTTERHLITKLSIPLDATSAMTVETTTSRSE